MRSPFPGMDPYVESQGGWQDFHNGVIAEIRRVLARGLPRGYVARFDERIEVVGIGEDRGSWFKPDVMVGRRSGAEAPARGLAQREAMTIEPVVIDICDRDLDEVRETWIEIRRLPEMELVTVIEVLSPTNKSGAGRLSYLEKRDDLHSRGIHLVEIDLLLGGRPLPMAKPLPPGHFFAIVARAETRPKADVYAWSVRDRLPVIPIPLKSPDPDVMLDLGAVTDSAYQDGRYAETIRYHDPLPDGLPIAPEDRAWAESMGDAPAAPRPE